MKQKWCDQSKLNLSIDTVMLLLLMSLAGIGFLIKYVLIPGIQRNERYGSNVDLEFWGFTRHEWGSIHLIIGIVFLVLLIIHIILHWEMIVCIFRRMIPNKILRTVSATLLTGVSLILIAFPLFVRPELIEREPLHQNRQKRQSVSEGTTVNTEPVDSVFSKSNSAAGTAYHQEDHVFAEPEINGSQTLQSVADAYGIPADKIASDLNIPLFRIGEKLGRLRKQYEFTMDDVRNSVLKNKK